MFTIYGFGQTFPQETWEYNEDFEADGWNMKKLESAYDYLIDSTRVTGLIVVHKGKIVVEYGNVSDNSYIASCRKSVLAMLYGPYVQSGAINLKDNLKRLNVDDIGGLLPNEKKATIEHIISARSGVYHLASNHGDFLRFAPERGSVKPGSYWLYSNWDFNVAGHIFEQEAQVSIYEALESQLAFPLKFQDWDLSLQQKSGDTSRSNYMAYHMWLSTRDMARLGLLMLNRGAWDGQEIVPAFWVDEMVTEHTSSEEVNKNVPVFDKSPIAMGYGYMWWLWDNMEENQLNDGYSALGAFGQSITVFPSLDVVIAYKTNVEYERRTTSDEGLELLRRLAISLEYGQ